MNLKSNLKEDYSPLYFLSSLGAGGLSVAIYMYLMFMIEHPKVPLATAEYIFPLIKEGNFVSVLIVLNILLVLMFSFIHFKLLIWNFKEYKIFKTSEKFKKLKTSNEEVTLMAIPLTLAMSINVCFVLGAALIPELWGVVEYLFPFAIIAFLAVGIYGLNIYGNFLTRLVISGGFEFEKNSNFSQMLAVFAFSMVSVGLAAPGAMSHYIGISAFGLFFSLFFMVLSIVLLFKSMFLAFKSMYRYGILPESAASLWMLIPIATLLGIALIRVSFGLVHNFEQEPSSSFLFMLTAGILSFQIVIGMFGYKVMKTLNYFKDYLHSDVKSAAALGLVCPGVAIFVFGMFFIFFGLLSNEVLEIFSVRYFIVLAPLVFIQLKTIQVFFKLFKKLLLK
ncbi:MAG: hypothetical protein JJV94_00890 [Sulfurospirillum sp.]|nr:hypothetical protein [Sulfurospirillum sp.]